MHSNERHKSQKDNDADEMKTPLDLPVDRFSADRFYDQEHEPSAVKRRKRKQIDDAQIRREQDKHVQHFLRPGTVHKVFLHVNSLHL